MELSEFRQDFINEIEAEAIELAEQPCEVFIRRVADILINDYSYLSELNSLFYEYTKGTVKFKSMRIDAQSLELSTNTLNLMYIDYNSGDMQILNKNFTDNAQRLINYFENCIKGFFDNKAFDFSIPAVSLSAEIRSHYDEIHKIHLFLASTDKLNERLKTISLPAISLVNRTFQVELDVIDIYKIYQTKLSDFQKEEIEINTIEYGVEGIPCIKAQLESDSYDAYLAIIPGAFLSDIYKQYGPRLLEANVRSFLSIRGAVNKGIRRTILNQPDKFFTYNNGISTTAKAITTKTNENGLLITSFKDLQIINGGQTTASLASATIKDKHNLCGIYVQMKLTIINEDANSVATDFVRNIAKYANSQNKVTAADLNSNHEFYIRIEEFSRKTYAPSIENNTYQTLWFFERSRGQYDQAKMKMTKAQKETFERINPPKQVIKKTDIAKYINSCEQQPFSVSWGAEVNLTRFQERLEEDWKKDNTKFNVSYYRDLIAKAILFKEVEKTISHLDWYQSQKAYRAQLVTYSIAKLFYEIGKTKRCFNFKKVWDKQAIPDFILEDISSIAKLAYDTFTDPNRSSGNVETYCKNKLCWDSLKNKTFNLNLNTLAFLLDEDDVIIENTRSQKEQRLDNALTADIQIFNIGSVKWGNYLEKGKEQGLINGHEIEMLQIAIKFSNNVYTSLKTKQATDILQIKEKLDNLGILV